MTEKVESTNSIKDAYKDTYAYTYEVTMVIQILAPTKEIADVKLDQDGGYISKRDVKFKYSTLLHGEILEEESSVTSEKEEI